MNSWIREWNCPKRKRSNFSHIGPSSKNCKRLTKVWFSLGFFSSFVKHRGHVFCDGFGSVFSSHCTIVTSAKFRPNSFIDSLLCSSYWVYWFFFLNSLFCVAYEHSSFIFSRYLCLLTFFFCSCSILCFLQSDEIGSVCDKYSTKVEISINRVRKYENTVLGLKFSYWTLRKTWNVLNIEPLLNSLAHSGMERNRSKKKKEFNGVLGDNEYPKQVVMILHCLTVTMISQRISISIV